MNVMAIFHRSVEQFLSEDVKSWGARLREHHVALQGDQPTKEQVRAWAHSFKVLQTALSEVVQHVPQAQAWTIIFEYELPRERGRRPDVILLTENQILVLEFKDHPYVSPLKKQAQLDQVRAYARDLREYHTASHGRQVKPFLVYANQTNQLSESEEVTITGQDTLAECLLRVKTVQDAPLDHAVWMAADYAPLPTLVSAARQIFNHEPLPALRRASSAGIPETVAYLLDVAEKAKQSGGYHLALVTGVPGAGKTLVGLQFVYSNVLAQGDGQRDAVFLSGNGPLVNVLQHALQNKIFVQGVHDFLKQYGGKRERLPTEHIWVYDEAQRAWDTQQVQEKRNHGASEPEDFLRLGSRMPEWGMLVGLIGEGQEIHIGEEAGLRQWNDALAAVDIPWTVHAPSKISHVFSNAAAFEVSDQLDLTASLRSHSAEDLQTWIKKLLAGEIREAAAHMPQIQGQGFKLYVTDDLQAAKDYLRELYSEQPDKRYGLLASSKGYSLKSEGIDTWAGGVQHHVAGPWFNNAPDDPKSCCQLERVATEFVCQGLELDFPLVCWADDLTWSGSKWQVKPGRPNTNRRQPEDPEQLRLNSYRVLLSRGRDGMILFVPPQPKLRTTRQLLDEVGVPQLPSNADDAAQQHELKDTP